MVATAWFASPLQLTKAPTMRALQQGTGSLAGCSLLTERFREEVQRDENLRSLDFKGSSEYREQEKKER